MATQPEPEQIQLTFITDEQIRDRLAALESELQQQQNGLNHLSAAIPSLARNAAAIRAKLRELRRRLEPRDQAG